jgi:hypothetical protein
MQAVQPREESIACIEILNLVKFSPTERSISLSGRDSPGGRIPLEGSVKQALDTESNAKDQQRYKGLFFYHDFGTLRLLLK